MTSSERGLRAMIDTAKEMSSQCEIVLKKKGKAKGIENKPEGVIVPLNNSFPHPVNTECHFSTVISEQI